MASTRGGIASRGKNGVWCVCAWLAQYREATSDLTEALGFIKTVHADELTGYDGDSVRHIVDTLRASRPHLYPPAVDLLSYNATSSSVACPMMECYRVDDMLPQRAVAGLSPG